MLYVGCSTHNIVAILLAKTDLLAKLKSNLFYTILRLNACKIVITIKGATRKGLRGLKPNF